MISRRLETNTQASRTPSQAGGWVWEDWYWTRSLPKYQEKKPDTVWTCIYRSERNTLDTNIIVGTTSGTRSKRKAGRRRIHDVKDWTRLEIKTAAERQTSVETEGMVQVHRLFPLHAYSHQLYKPKYSEFAVSFAILICRKLLGENLSRRRMV